MAATTVGYCGGRAPWPTYGDMGDHTEAVRVEFDPGVTTFDDILRFVLPSGGRNRSQTRQYMTAVCCVEINHWFGGFSPNFRILYLGQIEVDSADSWTSRLLSSSSRSTAEELASKLSHMRTLKAG